MFFTALNILRTAELIIHLGGTKSDLDPLRIIDDCVERVSDFRFLGVHIVDKNTIAEDREEALLAAGSLERTKKMPASLYRCSIEAFASLHGPENYQLPTFLPQRDFSTPTASAE